MPLCHYLALPKLHSCVPEKKKRQLSGDKRQPLPRGPPHLLTGAYYLPVFIGRPFLPRFPATLLTRIRLMASLFCRRTRAHNTHRVYST